MDRVYITNEDLGYIASAVQRTNELLIEIHELNQRAVNQMEDRWRQQDTKRWYGAWAGKHWLTDERQEVRAYCVPAIMQANLVQWGLAGLFEVREIGDDGLPVPIEEAG